MTQQQKGTLLVFLASVCYSLGGICMKGIPWSGFAVNGGRTAIAVVVMGIYLWRTNQRLHFNRWIALGAAAVSCTNILFSVANKMTTAANAIVLQYTAPIFVILLAALFIHKQPSRLDLAACAVVFGGVLCFFVDSLSGGGLAGDMLALISGITYAVVFMLNDLPGGDALSSAFWGHVFSAAVGLPFVLQETDFSTVPMISMLVLGIFQGEQLSFFWVRACKPPRRSPQVWFPVLSLCSTPFWWQCSIQELIGLACPLSWVLSSWLAVWWVIMYCWPAV